MNLITLAGIPLIVTFVFPMAIVNNYFPDNSKPCYKNARGSCIAQILIAILNKTRNDSQTSFPDNKNVTYDNFLSNDKEVAKGMRSKVSEDAVVERMKEDTKKMKEREWIYFEDPNKFEEAEVNEALANHPEEDHGKKVSEVIETEENRKKDIFEIVDSKIGKVRQKDGREWIYIENPGDFEESEVNKSLTNQFEEDHGRNVPEVIEIEENEEKERFEVTDSKDDKIEGREWIYLDDSKDLTGPETEPRTIIK